MLTVTNKQETCSSLDTEQLTLIEFNQIKFLPAEILAQDGRVGAATATGGG